MNFGIGDPFTWMDLGVGSHGTWKDFELPSPGAPRPIWGLEFLRPGWILELEALGLVWILGLGPLGPPKMHPRHKADFGWIWDGFWIDLGWILNELFMFFSMDFGRILAGF